MRRIQNYKIELKIDTDNIDTIYNFPIYINLTIDTADRKFQAQLLCWSNNAQDNVLLKKSDVVEVLSKDEALKCIKYYENIVNNYVDFLYDTIKTKEQLDDLIEKISSPKFIYTKQLINAFSKNKLDYMMKECFKIRSIILDIDDFTKIIPKNINGWYADDIEVTGSDEQELPYIF